MPKLVSVRSTTFFLAMGAQKLGQPVPDSNFVSELKSAVSQQIQRSTSFSCKFRSSPVKGLSVPAYRATLKESGDNSLFPLRLCFLDHGNRHPSFPFAGIREFNNRDPFPRPGG